MIPLLVLIIGAAIIVKRGPKNAMVIALVTVVVAGLTVAAGY